jgi:hypothetical protein
MFEKQGKFYADWRDTDGNRLRKSFTSKRAALLYESEQKELAHPKTAAKGRTSPLSFARKQRGAEPTAKQQPASSRLAVVPRNPKNSVQPAPPKLITSSTTSHGRTRPKRR